MRKYFSGFIVLILFLTACNLGPDATVVTPTVDIVATQVAQTLTKISSGADKPLTNITIVQLTKPAVSQSTITPAVVSPTLAATTQVPSQTATSTVTPTAVPGDPRTTLGTPTWKDTFQKAAAWGLDSPYDDGHTRVSIAPGKIVLSSKDGNGWHGWRMLTTKIQNFYLEATINTLDCSGSDKYGVIFRSPNSFKGYWLGFTCDGRYGLELGDINDSSEIIKLKANPLIKSGSNQTNRIGVLVKGNKLSLYANGKLLEDITNDTLPDAGVFGYFIAGYKTINFTFESTEIAYWKLP
jgi:hypothetical protein